MGEIHRLGFVAEHKRPQEVGMGGRDRLERHAVNVLEAGAFGESDTVGCERIEPAEALMQPVVADQHVRVVARYVLEEPLEHAVVVALEEDPVVSCVAALDQPVEHGLAVGSAVRVVAQEDHAGIRAAIRLDQAQHTLQLGKLAVDVADGIERFGHVDPSGVEEAPGRHPPLVWLRRRRTATA